MWKLLQAVGSPEAVGPALREGFMQSHEASSGAGDGPARPRSATPTRGRIHRASPLACHAFAAAPRAIAPARVARGLSALRPLPPPALARLSDYSGNIAMTALSMPLYLHLERFRPLRSALRVHEPPPSAPPLFLASRRLFSVPSPSLPSAS